MAIKVSQAFERTSANAIDTTLTLTKAQMLTVNDNLMPSKYLTICQDDGAIYLYDKSATPSQTTGKFTKFEGGGGADLPTGGTTNQALVKKSNSDNDVEWKDIIQYATMPTASADNLGQIIQFIGTTTSTYINGLFYECVTDGTVYSWELKDVQTYPEVDLSNVFASGYPGVTTSRNVNYSLEEQEVGTWIDGKPIYQKTIDCGALLNTASKRILHNINSLDKIINYQGFMYANNTEAQAPIPTINMSPSSNYDTAIWTDNKTEIIITTFKDATNFFAYTTLQYTKTTD